MQNCKELRDALSAAYDALRNKEIGPKEAAEFSSIASKMITSAKIQVSYYALRKEYPNIEFLNEINK